MVKKIVKGPTSSSKIKSQWRKVYDDIAKMRTQTESQNDIEDPPIIIDKSIDPKLFRFQTLIGLLLSSQTKDSTSSQILSKLQNQDLSPERMASMPAEDIADIIYGVRFHNNKAKYIKKTSQILLEKYNGDIPNDFKKVIALPGIGPKMAYLFLQICYGKVEGIPVDTHVHRVANRLGWVKSKNEQETRKQLQEMLPQDLWAEADGLLLDFGQNICTARKPKCGECDISKFCPYYKANHKK